MGALPAVLDDFGLDPNEIGKASEPTSTSDLYLSEEDEEEEDTESIATETGPHTPELHLISPSPIITANNLDAGFVQF